MTTKASRRQATGTVVVSALAALALAACSGGGEAVDMDATTAPSTTAASGDEMEEPEPETDEGSDSGGDVSLPASGELDGRRVTVESTGSTTFVLQEPDPNLETIYIEVTVENVAAEPWDSSVFQFFLVDEETGDEISPTLDATEAGDLLPQVNPLEQGASSTGFIGYEVPPGSSLRLSYAVDLSAGQTIEIPVR